MSLIEPNPDAVPAVIAWTSGTLRLVPATRELLVAGARVEVEGKVFDLIEFLLARHPEALDKDTIVRHLWGHRPVTDAALSQLVYKARRAIGDEDRSRIRTVYGHGLAWSQAVARETLPADAHIMPTAAEAQAQPAAPRAATTPPARRATRPFALGLAAALLITVAAALLMWIEQARTALHPPEVAVLPIENATGDQAFDWVHFGLPALITNALDEAGLRTVDPRQAALLASQAGASGNDVAGNVRRGSGARHVVRGRLLRVGVLFRLELEVDGAAANAVEASGPAPAQLAIALAGNLAGRLAESQRARASVADKTDTWLAETYARGMDLAARGEWADARPYLELVVREDPDAPRARLDLARIEARTGHEKAARATLDALIERADASAEDLLRARMERAMLIARGGDRATAATALRELREPAHRSGIATLPAWIEMNLAELEAALGESDAALRAWERAAAIIGAAGLKDYEPRLHNIAAGMALERGDLGAAAEANQRALEASNAIGFRSGAMASALNAGILVLRDGRARAALPLLTTSLADAAALDDEDALLIGTQNLIEAALTLGAGERARPLFDALEPRVLRRGLPELAATQLALRGWLDLERGDAQAAARQFGAIRARLTGADLDLFLPPVLELEARAAWMRKDASALAALAREARRLEANRGDPAQLALSAELFEAMAAALQGADAHAQKLLADATRQAALARDAATRNRLRIAALRIAAQTNAVRLPARIDVAADNENAEILDRARAFFERTGDARAARRIEAQLAILKRDAGTALEQTLGLIAAHE